MTQWFTFRYKAQTQRFLDLAVQASHIYKFSIFPDRSHLAAKDQGPPLGPKHPNRPTSDTSQRYPCPHRSRHTQIQAHLMPLSYQKLNDTNRTGPWSTIHLPHCSPANPNPNCATQALHRVKPFSFIPKGWAASSPGRNPARNCHFKSGGKKAQTGLNRDNWISGIIYTRYGPKTTSLRSWYWGLLCVWVWCDAMVTEPHEHLPPARTALAWALAQQFFDEFWWSRTRLGSSTINLTYKRGTKDCCWAFLLLLWLLLPSTLWAETPVQCQIWSSYRNEDPQPFLLLTSPVPGGTIQSWLSRTSETHIQQLQSAKRLKHTHQKPHPDPELYSGHMTETKHRMQHFFALKSISLLPFPMCLPMGSHREKSSSSDWPQWHDVPKQHKRLSTAAAQSWPRDTGPLLPALAVTQHSV